MSSRHPTPRFSLIATSTLALIALVLASGAALAGEPRLLLRGGTVELGALDEAAPRADEPRGEGPRPGARDAPSGPALRVVAFAEVPGIGERRALEQLGARVLAFLPESAYVVRAADPAALAALPGVRWVGALRAEWKLDAQLEALAKERPRAIVELWDDAEVDALAGHAASLGLAVHARWDALGVRRLLVDTKPALLAKLAEHEDVAFIEPAPKATLRNDAATWVVQSFEPELRPIWDRGLHGQGQIIGNIDDRLDMNSCYFDDGGAEPGPGHRKVIAYRSSNGLGAASHGTHTNGTMAGDQPPYGEPSPGDGHAFAAKIAFANLSDIDGSGSAPSNLLEYLTFAHDDGARVHTNSWGDDGTTNYTSWSRDIDDFMWQNEESLVLFAITNGSSLRTPENAKNLLAVGATERELNADNHCTGGEGPTSDGRRKPEIYAPGCSTSSARSSDPCGLRSLTGTSMASPAVAGTAALVRQYYAEGWYPSGSPIGADALVPSGALLKATLIAGTMDMTGVGGFPSDLEGWGRVQLERSLFFEGDLRGLAVLDDLRNAEGLESGGELTYSLEVVDESEDLRIVLAFSEPPAELLAAAATINDLDLIVEAPDGTVYRGNATDGLGNSVADGADDDINNLEVVLFDTPPQLGTWLVRVRAENVPVGPQGFALVATGGVENEAVAGARIRYVGHRFTEEPPGGNGNGSLDPGETIVVPVSLRNASSEPATAISGRLVAERPDWARVTIPEAAWPDLAGGETSESLPPHFEVVTSPEAPCGEELRFTLTTRAAESTEDSVSGFSIDIGSRLRDFPGGEAVDLPPAAFGATESILAIGDDLNILELDVSVDIAHGDVSEMRVILSSPEGTQVQLHDRSDPGQRDLVVRYDLDRPVAGPGSLDDFFGESTEGTWTLFVADNVASGVPGGRVRGWSLHVRAGTVLECAPLDCAEERPGAVDPGLLVEREGADLVFSWPGVPGAAGYHLLEDGSPQLGALELLERTSGETSARAEGEAEAGQPGALTYYVVRAVNSCGWEGP